MRVPNPDALPDRGVATRNMVADYLGLTVRTVDQMASDGRLKKINGLGSRVTLFDVAYLRNKLSS